jgi:hypothetical protein
LTTDSAKNTEKRREMNNSDVNGFDIMQYLG